MSLTFRLATPLDAIPLTNLINTAFRNDPTTDVFLSPSHEGIDVTSLSEVEAAISDASKSIILAVLPSSSSSSSTGSTGSTSTSLPDQIIIAHCSLRLLLTSESPGPKNKTEKKTAWLGLLAVDPTSQNKGTGSALLNYAEQYARQELGATRMEFDVVWTRTKLIGWYKGRGYEETGEKSEFPYDRHPGWEGVLRGDLGLLNLGKEI
ncbi:acyl-CoA N-acyltransferase [Cladorrhinum sp. PSN259]|nr:acyl-CoA N-acyltransferase [Cladorrhinum sp. PSN259]